MDTIEPQSGDGFTLIENIPFTTCSMIGTRAPVSYTHLTLPTTSPV